MCVSACYMLWRCDIDIDIAIIMLLLDCFSSYGCIESIECTLKKQ